MKVWIFAALCVVAGVRAQSDEDLFDYWDPDTNEDWFNKQFADFFAKDNEAENGADEDPNNYNDYDNILSVVRVGSEEKTLDDLDKKVEEEIQQLQLNSDRKEDKDNTLEDSNDYQFEDNRSDPEANKVGSDEKKLNAEDKVAENLHVPKINTKDDENKSEPAYDDDDYALPPEGNLELLSDLQQVDIDDSAKEIEYAKNDDIALLPTPLRAKDEMQKILDETAAILNEEKEAPNDFEAKENDDKVNDNNDLRDIIEETKNILEKTNSQFDEDVQETNASSDNVNARNNVNDEIVESKNSTDETGNELEENIVDKNKSSDIDDLLLLLTENLGEDASNDDTNNVEEDIKKYIEETQKILEDTDTQFDEEVLDENIDVNKEDKKDEILNYDDTVDKVYDDLNTDLDKLLETINKLTLEGNDNIDKDALDHIVNSDESIHEDDDYENVFDSNLSELFAKHSNEVDNNNVEENDEPRYNGHEVVDDDEEKSLENDADKKLVIYVNDAIEPTDAKPSISVDDLSSAELDKLMDDFVAVNKEVIKSNVHVELSDNHVIHEVDVKYGEKITITSDNYPAAYPTNRVVDWIITGEGVGIELNITDFAINSALGDYLLMKPGRADESGDDGLVFSYFLNSPHAYRFTDVDRMFVRFEALQGMSFLRGFSFTVTMIAPVPAEPEPEPEPEPLLPSPHSVVSVIIGGLSLEQFTDIEEEFRQIVADMATLYINANHIEHGLNTTSEVTQIVGASVCNVHWPNYEQCISVKFSVPLVYEDEEQELRLNEDDLKDMWFSYVDRDPFALRLKNLGITEFAIPNDGNVLMVWMVIAIGVLLSAAMLAFALWRYSCSENYSRMPVFSDTDSVNEKRGLDLYPTPHQTLPPLYSESEYKWGEMDDTARVDMGGFANRSFTQDIYDMESDEDVVPRERFTTDV